MTEVTRRKIVKEIAYIIREMAGSLEQETIRGVRAFLRQALRRLTMLLEDIDKDIEKLKEKSSEHP
jgi:hypothetical protein